MADWLLPTFSTTLPRDRTIAAAVYLGTMLSDLATRVARLSEFNADALDEEGSSVSEWSRCLTVVLDRMVGSFDRPDYDGLRDFWTRACHSGGDSMSGSVVHFSGWLTAFCWWRADGIRQKAYSDKELQLEYRWCDEKWERLEISGVGDFPVIDQSKIPVGLTSVPITLANRVVGGEEASDDTVETILLAGSGGTKLLDANIRLEQTTMPPKKNSDAGAVAASLDCTESEIKLMIAIMELMARPALDYDALAAKLGSASTNAARMRVTAAVNKHPTWFTGGGTAATNEDGTPVKKARAKRTPKKKKAPSDEEDGDSAEKQGTPSKKKARTAKVKEELEDTAAEDIKPKLENAENAETAEGQI
ncbi:hypothetical protein CSIM01_01558 [Colletotrichum simmondsii]|uniref:Uncharacterized protein n=1 Tax=Colletotrichum simmondsii TaxID=703756 RepID=A0A135TRB9_9PEZI|nr:hypothetical protein CSIM01_01558 [Colletotrichum simmondsii]